MFMFRLYSILQREISIIICNCNSLHNHLNFFKFQILDSTVQLNIQMFDDFQMADHLCNSVGILQQFAPPGQFAGFEKSGSKSPAVTNEGV